ncbi:MAG TPA: hypothetical protein VFG99_00145, partial [Chloroflexia bacterium]|nr:hypothetical protein [Chloroflexia bacterium]
AGLTLAVVNRDPRRAVAATVSLADGEFTRGAIAYEVTGPSPLATNSFGREEVGLRERPVEVALDPGRRRGQGATKIGTEVR